MIPVTPRGFKDVLPEEARIREQLRRKASDVLDLWGYDPIETPALEVLEVLERGSKVDKATFRLFDHDDNLLVLRPDVTLPIARMVATRLSDEEGPFRFRYDLPVFRDNESSKGSSREFTQIGIEQIGLGGHAADAETILAFIESLDVCGLDDFRIEFCNVRVLENLLDACDMGGDFNRAVLSAYHAANHVKLDNVVDASDASPELASCLKRLIRIHGGRDAIVECADLLRGFEDEAVFDELLGTWDIIESCGYASRVGVDFSLLSSFDYYTGIIFEAYAPGIGASIGGGGRYDNLLAVFGRRMPAAGFAFSLDGLMHALSVQGSLDASLREVELVEIDSEDEGMQGEDAAFARLMELHGQGKAACLGGAR